MQDLKRCNRNCSWFHAANCSAIRLPESTYPLWDALPPEVVEQGRLSQLQLEGVLYACTKHQQFLPTGERAYMSLSSERHGGF